MVTSRTPARRLLTLVAVLTTAAMIFALVPTLADAAGSPATAQASAKKKKKKKKAKACKRGYKKKGKKCVRRTLTVGSVTLQVGIIKDRKVKVSGYSEFGYKTKADAFLHGRIIVSDGLGRQTINAYWFVPKGLTYINFGGAFKVSLNKPRMTVRMKVGKVTSNLIVDEVASAATLGARSITLP